MGRSGNDESGLSTHRIAPPDPRFGQYFIEDGSRESEQQPQTIGIPKVEEGLLVLLGHPMAGAADIPGPGPELGIMLGRYADPMTGDEADNAHDLAEVAAILSVKMLFVGGQSSVHVVEIHDVAQGLELIHRNPGASLHSDELEHELLVAGSGAGLDGFAPGPDFGPGPGPPKPHIRPLVGRQPRLDIGGQRRR